MQVAEQQRLSPKEIAEIKDRNIYFKRQELQTARRTRFCKMGQGGNHKEKVHG